MGIKSVTGAKSILNKSESSLSQRFDGLDLLESSIKSYESGS